ncbi:hypothetical protein GGR94_003002 [Sulfitobacter geojensis]|nr:hypothetical protein [Sulfitobacter geojensis]
MVWAGCSGEFAGCEEEKVTKNPRCFLATGERAKAGLKQATR